jgi:hypothetical protein
MANSGGHTHWALWPITFLWRLLATIVEMTGRFVAILLGILLMAAGLVCNLTIVGAIVGIPLFLVGLLLLIRGVF